MIIKVQLPIGGDRSAGALVYNEDRSVCMQVPSSQVAKRLRRGEEKGYFHAEIDGDSLEIGERVDAEREPAW